MGTHIDKIAKQFNEVISVSIQFKEALKGLGDMKSVQQAMKANTDNIKKYNAVIKQLQDQKQKISKTNSTGTCGT